MHTKQDVLQDCTIDGNIVRLPAGQLDRKLYQDVAKSIELIGGKWTGRSIMGFVFPQDPTELLAQIATGEKRNIKKEFQFFATPDHLADQLVSLANLEEYDMVLEPSAGQGAIIKAIQREFAGLVHYCELMDINRTFCAKLPNVQYITDNFLKLPTKAVFRQFFHKIIANPPFSKNQDIDHVNAMYQCLAPGGRIVSITGTHWQYSSNKKEKAFKAWLDDLNADIIPVDAGVFNKSGTNIATVILVIDKPTT